jgi:hypothetical protein
MSDKAEFSLIERILMLVVLPVLLGGSLVCFLTGDVGTKIIYVLILPFATLIFMFVMRDLYQDAELEGYYYYFFYISITIITYLIGGGLGFFARKYFNLGTKI